MKAGAALSAARSSQGGLQRVVVTVKATPGMFMALKRNG